MTRLKQRSRKMRAFAAVLAVSTLTLPGLTGTAAAVAGPATNNAAYTFGGNDDGQLGIIGFDSQSAPVAVRKIDRVSGLGDIVDIDFGGRHMLAVDSEGVVWVAGGNSSGELGLGDNHRRDAAISLPKSAFDGKTVIDVSAGARHSAAVTSNGDLYTWGSDSLGQAGLPGNAGSTTPQKVDGVSNIVAVAAGGFHTLALQADGTVLAVGSNSYGQLGDGTTTPSDTFTPVTTVAGTTTTLKATEITAGLGFSAARVGDRVAVWGANGDGQLSQGDLVNQAAPVWAKDSSGNILTGINQISAGDAFWVGVTNSNTVIAVGDNRFGQLGNDSNIDADLPVTVNAPFSISKVAAGSHHVLAVGSDQRIWAWGNNDHGQLGIGSYGGTQDHPVAVADPENGLAQLLGSNVAAGPQNSAVITNRTAVDNRISYLCSWGDASRGLIGDGTLTNALWPVEPVGPDGTGTIGKVIDIAQGSRETDKIVDIFNPPTPITNGGSGNGPGNGNGNNPDPWRYIPSGTIALTDDGNVYTWGEGYLYRESGGNAWIPGLINQDYKSLLSSGEEIVDVESGSGSFYMLTSHGRVLAAGYDINGRLGRGGTSSSWRPWAFVQAGELAGYYDANGNVMANASAPLRGVVDLEAQGAHVGVVVQARTSAGGALNSYGLVWGRNASHRATATGTTTNDVTRPRFVRYMHNGSTVLPNNVTDIDVGRFNTVFVHDGQIYVGGADWDGSRGAVLNPSGNEHFANRLQSTPNNVTNVTVGERHGAARTALGNVITWGANDVGQLARNYSATSDPAPDRAQTTAGPVLTNIEHVQAAGDHTLALTASGRVYAWGGNDYGYLGSGSEARDGATVVWNHTGEPGSELVSVAKTGTGGDVSWAILNNGKLYVWGDNSEYQLAQGEDHIRLEPSQTDSEVFGRDAAGITKIDGSSFHMLALTVDGKVLSVGDNTHGQLGNGDQDGRTSTLGFVRGVGGIGLLGEGEVVPGTPSGKVVDISTSAWTSYALLESGHVVAWGRNYFGALGLNNPDVDYNVIYPTPVTGPNGVGVLNDIVSIGAGWNSAYARTSTGRVWSWGNNDNGQLSVGDVGKGVQYIPVPTATYRVGSNQPMDGVRFVDGGFRYVVFLMNDGTVLAAGENSKGQIGNGNTHAQEAHEAEPVKMKAPGNPPINHVIKVSVGSLSSLALRDVDGDGRGDVWGWGSNMAGQIGLGSFDTNPIRYAEQVRGVNGTGYLTNVIDIAMGQSAAYSGRPEDGQGFLLYDLDSAAYAVIDDGNGDDEEAGDGKGVLLSWGLGAHGRLGSGDLFDRALPGYVVDPLTGGTLNGVTGVVAGERNVWSIREGGGCKRGPGAPPPVTTNRAPIAEDDYTWSAPEANWKFNVLTGEGTRDGLVDTDPDHGDIVSLVAWTQGYAGQLACATNGDCVYHPAVGETGTFTIDVLVCDTGGLCDTSKLTVDINSGPVPNFQTYTLNEYEEDDPDRTPGTWVFDLVADMTDPEGDAISLTNGGLVPSPTTGALNPNYVSTINSDGSGGTGGDGNGGGGNAGVPSLVLTHPTACEALYVSGSSKLTATSINGGPGSIYVDSDASDCDTGKAAITLDGNVWLTAENDGAIVSHALEGPHASKAHKVPAWLPTNQWSEPVPGERYGRGSVDARYGAAVDDLHQRWAATTGTPAGFTKWSDWMAENRPYVTDPCNVNGGTSWNGVPSNGNPYPITVPAGNYHFDCPNGINFGGDGNVVFQGGDIVSDGPIGAAGSVRLAINCSSGTVRRDWVADAQSVVNDCGGSPGDTTIVVRNGDVFGPGDTNVLLLLRTFVYTPNGTFSLGGDKSVFWTAPIDGSFEDLAFFTESNKPITISGNKDVKIDGVFFAPNAAMTISGSRGFSNSGMQTFLSTLRITGNVQWNFIVDASRAVLPIPADEPAEGYVTYTVDLNQWNVVVDTGWVRVCDKPGDRHPLAACSTFNLDSLVNRHPVANDDGFIVLIGEPTPLEILNNDEDPNHRPGNIGDHPGTMTITLLTTPEHGTATVDGDVIVYTSRANYLGPDSFRYRICDQGAAGNPGLCWEADVDLVVDPHAIRPV